MRVWKLAPLLIACHLGMPLVFADDVKSLKISDKFLDKIGDNQRAIKPLKLVDVLAASNQHMPAILASISDRNAASGRALSAQGAFDTTLSTDGFRRATGFWDGQVVNTEARRNLDNVGVQVYGGYRLSDGNFPIYEDVNFTNSLGEAKVGALFSLLRNRDIDTNRFTRRDSQLALEQSKLDVLLTQVSIQRAALIAYWRWIAAGKQYSVYSELLDIALERQKALDIQVEEGAVAEIFKLENQQNITRRQTLKTQAEQALRTTANQLSFYLRSSEGNTRIPSSEEIPVDITTSEFSNNNYGRPISVSEILSTRPELQQLRIAVERINQKIRLRENDLKPQLDFNVELSHDLGSVKEGGESRDSTDGIIGFEFSVPLGLRAARGNLETAKAEKDAINYRVQALEDQIAIEIENIIVDLEAAINLLKLAQRDVVQTQAMAVAESQRFENGASDFFLVNVREENSANARIAEYKALLQLKAAEASFAAATIDVEHLGITFIQ